MLRRDIILAQGSTTSANLNFTSPISNKSSAIHKKTQPHLQQSRIAIITLHVPGGAFLQPINDNHMNEPDSIK